MDREYDELEREGKIVHEIGDNELKVLSMNRCRKTY